MKSILFVCDANQFRSVIAAEYFRYLLSKNDLLDDWMIGSAGTWTESGHPPLQEAISFANSRGFRVDHIRSREVTTDILKEANLIVVMTFGQKEALSLEFPQCTNHILILTELCIRQAYDIPDPTKNEDVTFNEIASEICLLIDQGFEKICMTMERY